MAWAFVARAAIAWLGAIVMASWHLKGISISILGNVCQNLANNILAQRGQQQQHEHNRNRRRFGAVLFVASAVLIFASYPCAPGSLLAPLGSVQFVSNVVFLKVMHRAPITRRVVAATAAILVGCTFVILSSSDENPETTLTSLERWFSADTYLAYSLVLAALLPLLQWSYSMHRRKRWVYRSGVLMPVCYVTISAIVGTWSTVLAKAVAGLLLGSIRDFRHGLTWLAVFGMLGGQAFDLYRRTTALARFEPPQFIIPLLQVEITVFATVNNAVFFQEMPRNPLLFMLGILGILVGVVGLSGSAATREEAGRVPSRSETEEEMTADAYSTVYTIPLASDKRAIDYLMEQSDEEDEDEDFAEILPSKLRSLLFSQNT